MENLLISVSGGRSSALMAYHINTSPKYSDYNKLFVFANTGMERFETIEFLWNIKTKWGIDLRLIECVSNLEKNKGVGYKEVTFDTLSYDAEPFNQAIIHANKGIYSGLPHSEAPYCSTKMKKDPINKFASVFFGTNRFITALGYRFEDMPNRITFAELKHDKTIIAPLLTDFTLPLSQKDVLAFFSANDFDLAIPSQLGNCELCWKKSDKRLRQGINYGTRFVDWWLNKENQYGNTSFRGNRSIADFLNPTNQMEIDFGEKDDTIDCLC